MNARNLPALASRAEPWAFAALRIVSGGMFLFHGVQKVFAFQSAKVVEVGSQAWIGGVIELSCGALILLGLLTRPAAFLASGTMAVAYFQFHWKFAFAESMWIPTINKGELAALYCFVFLFFVAHGGGAFSLDALIRTRRRSR